MIRRIALKASASKPVATDYIYLTFRALKVKEKN